VIKFKNELNINQINVVGGGVGADGVIGVLGGATVDFLSSRETIILLPGADLIS